MDNLVRIANDDKQPIATYPFSNVNYVIEWIDVNLVFFYGVGIQPLI